MLFQLEPSQPRFSRRCERCLPRRSVGGSEKSWFVGDEMSTHTGDETALLQTLELEETTISNRSQDD